MGRSTAGVFLRKARTVVRGLAWRLQRGPTAEPRVNYGPVPIEIGAGGTLRKAERLARHFPQVSAGFNILYVISGCPPPLEYCRAAKMAAIPVIVNAGAIYLRADYGDEWRKENDRIAAVYRLADYVLFQSEFSRWCYETHIGKPPCGSEVLYNAVDVALFSPQRSGNPSRPLTLLVGGLHRYLHSRVIPAIEALRFVRAEIAEACLILAGKFARPGDELVTRAWADRLGVANAVRFAGYYDLSSAPALFGEADILIHPIYYDACPSTVLEAMACGLPVVCPSTGGTPELVEDGNAGITVPSQMDFEKPYMLDPQGIASAALRIAENLDAFSKRARNRAVEHFDVESWYQRHDEVFRDLLNGRQPQPRPE